ncbi:fe-s cluster assembly protein [Lasius niger]|uniref:Fe-s cluster assembly protein n=1 Tax=Lasius niger TaxID=67767 RepID=A0A0J7K5W8_LASNI|nr:fe-s cluster assembly protein [Lasius niger]
MTEASGQQRELLDKTEQREEVKTKTNTLKPCSLEEKRAGDLNKDDGEVKEVRSASVGDEAHLPAVEIGEPDREETLTTVLTEKSEVKVRSTGTSPSLVPSTSGAKYIGCQKLTDPMEDGEQKVITYLQRISDSEESDANQKSDSESRKRRKM